MEKDENSSSDFYGIYKEIADVLGVENTIKLHSRFKGEQISFPVKLYSDEYVYKYVSWSLNNTTKSKKDLAREFQYTERRINRIVKNCKKEVSS